MSRPDGIESLEGVVASAKPNATVTMPAEWVRDLLAYVGEMEGAQTDPLAAWQLIETAPTDRFVLAGRAGQLPAAAMRGLLIWRQPYANNPLDFEPTHWMPLPDPPELRP